MIDVTGAHCRLYSLQLPSCPLLYLMGFEVLNCGTVAIYLVIYWDRPIPEMDTAWNSAPLDVVYFLGIFTGTGPASDSTTAHSFHSKKVKY